MIKNRFYSFENGQRQLLCKFSKTEPIDFEKFLNTSYKYISGLLYEIQNTGYNWQSKDRMLPELLNEINEIFSKIKTELEKFRQFENNSFDYEMKHEYKYSSELKANSLEYLMQLFNKKFLMDENLSDKFTHRMLEKDLRKMNKRLERIFNDYLQYLDSIISHYAKIGLNNLIINNIKGETLPSLFAVSDTFQKIFRNYNGYHVARDYSIIEGLITSSFLPDCANTEYHMAMNPIWEDMGTSITCYYFNYYPRTYKEEKEGLILLTKENKSTFEQINCYPKGKSFLEIFQEIDKGDLFEDWFNRDEVKDSLIYKLTSNIFWKFLDEDRFSEKEPERDFTKSTKILTKLLERTKEYYGLTLELENVIKIAREKKKECIKKQNLKEEYKEKQYEIIDQMFPEIIISEGGEES